MGGASRPKRALHKHIRQLELFPPAIDPELRSRISVVAHGRMHVIGVRRREIDLDKLTFALLRVTDQIRLDQERGRLIDVLRRRINALRRN